MMKKSEIIKQYPEEICQTYRPKSQNKSKELKNSFQISGKITEFISPNKTDENEDENNLLNTAKNSFPSNNAMTTRTNAPNISIFSDIPFNITKDTFIWNKLYHRTLTRAAVWLDIWIHCIPFIYFKETVFFISPYFNNKVR